MSNGDKMMTTLAQYDVAFLKKVPAVIGVDEAGRGPLAGPVTAAAVYLNRDFYGSEWLCVHGREINDSKQMTVTAREKIFAAIQELAAGQLYYACHMATVEEIEELNILGATRAAMARCIEDLMSGDCPFARAHEGEGWLFETADSSQAAHILVDGKPLKPFPFAHTAIVKGDGKSLAIALASIIAKVTRDRYMSEQAEAYPDYGFVTNKGYGTPKHIEALKTVGPCRIHRMSFLNQILTS